jgi:hypothetical protein
VVIDMDDDDVIDTDAGALLFSFEAERRSRDLAVNIARREELREERQRRIAADDDPFTRPIKDQLTRDREWFAERDAAWAAKRQADAADKLALATMTMVERATCEALEASARAIEYLRAKIERMRQEGRERDAKIERMRGLMVETNENVVRVCDLANSERDSSSSAKVVGLPTLRRLN